MSGDGVGTRAAEIIEVRNSADRLTASHSIHEVVGLCVLRMLELNTLWRVIRILFLDVKAAQSCSLSYHFLFEFTDSTATDYANQMPPAP